MPGGLPGRLLRGEPYRHERQLALCSSVQQSSPRVVPQGSICPQCVGHVLGIEALHGCQRCCCRPSKQSRPRVMVQLGKRPQQHRDVLRRALWQACTSARGQLRQQLCACRPTPAHAMVRLPAPSPLWWFLSWKVSTLHAAQSSSATQVHHQAYRQGKGRTGGNCIKNKGGMGYGIGGLCKCCGRPPRRRWCNDCLIRLRKVPAKAEP